MYYSNLNLFILFPQTLTIQILRISTSQFEIVSETKLLQWQEPPNTKPSN